MKVERVVAAVDDHVTFTTTDGGFGIVRVTPLLDDPRYAHLRDGKYLMLADVCDDGMTIGWPEGQRIAHEDLEGSLLDGDEALRRLRRKFGVTAEELDARAAEYESDDWSGMRFGEVVQGRPEPSDEGDQV